MTIGILGAGQLGRMLALAGYPLGLRFRFLDVNADAPGGHLAELLVGETFSDPNALDQFVDGVDCVTYEFENVPVDAARHLADRAPVYPPAEALEVAQDRLSEKSFFRELGIPVPPFAEINSLEDLQAAVAEFGCPAVLKTRRFGYDGKGQFVLRDPSDVSAAWEALQGSPLILEGFVRFDREVSILSVRAQDGEIRFYPLVENHHSHGILSLSLSPAPNLTEALQATAEQYARSVLERLNYVGVLAIELFQCGDELLANEMAPRVHNSGHWTIEGAETSQFENHIRAVAGLPLGSTAPVGYSAMLNIIGGEPDPRDVLSVPDAHLHLYGKAPVPGRKLGHLTVRAATPELLTERLDRLRPLIEASRR